MKKISRRSFLKQSLAMSAASMCSGGILIPFSGTDRGVVHAARPVDLAIAKRAELFQKHNKGGGSTWRYKKICIKRFKGGLLVNSPFKNYGAYVNPEITLAVVKMCFEAGAKEIWCPERAIRKVLAELQTGR